jgi:hypothetical protein
LKANFVAKNTALTAEQHDTITGGDVRTIVIDDDRFFRQDYAILAREYFGSSAGDLTFTLNDVHVAGGHQSLELFQRRQGGVFFRLGDAA